MSKSTKVMLLAFALGLVVAIATQASAQSREPVDLVPRWSYGPTAALTAIRQTDGQYHNEFLTGGAGMQINLNMVDSDNFPWIGGSVPVLMGGDSAEDSFRISPGLTITFLGNITMGGTYDLFYSKGGEATGIMTGHSSWEDNGTLLFGFTVPIGANAGVWTMGR